MERYGNLMYDAAIGANIEIMTAFNMIEMKTMSPEKMFYIAEGPVIESARHISDITRMSVR